MIGRGARPHGDKKNFWVIDQGRNVHKHGSLMNEAEWSLEPPKKRRKKGEGVAPVKECPECEALVHTSVMECPTPGCDHVWKKNTTLKQAEFEVIVPKILTTWPDRHQYSDVSLYVQDCIRYCRDRNYHKNSILHQIKNFPDAVAAYGSIKGYMPGWERHQRALQQ